MIYKFKSQSEGDVIMLTESGDLILSCLGRIPSEKGIITVEQIPADIATLEAAVIAHEEAETGANKIADFEIRSIDESVRLRDRAAPFIELLRNSAQAGKDVVWGV